MKMPAPGEFEPERPLPSRREHYPVRDWRRYSPEALLLYGFWGGVLIVAGLIALALVVGAVALLVWGVVALTRVL